MARKKSSSLRGGAVVVIVLLVAAFAAWHFGLVNRTLHLIGLEDGQTAPSATRSQVAGTGDSYVYSQLDEESREKYLILLDALEAREARSYPETDMDDLQRIQKCVMADHPELIDVSGVQLLTESNRGSGLVTNVSVEGQYSCSADEAYDMGRQLDAALAACTDALPVDAGDYEKAKSLYEYLSEHVEYDHAAASGASGALGAPSGQTAYDALVKGRAVCAGYARAYQLLLQRLGIPCVYVSGVANGGGHAWCAALLDGEWYFVDPTWGDPQFLDEGGQAGDSGHVDYDYLCVTSDDISTTHVIDSPYPAPACTSMADNYYVREGLFVSDGGIEAAGRIIQDAVGRGDSSVAFRCGAREQFDQLVRELFDGRAVYRYIPGDSCRYSLNERLLTVEVIF